jgi:LysR family hydrogen peroxide-inducible transcriptional activator
MVAAGVGVTLLPELAVQPPVPPSADVRLLRFEEPVPRREIALLWRRSSVGADLMPTLASVLRDLPAGLVGGAGTPVPAPAATPTGRRWDDPPALAARTATRPGT